MRERKGERRFERVGKKNSGVRKSDLSHIKKGHF